MRYTLSFVFRQRFRTYKDMYKDHLRDPDDQNITQELESQENDLDLFNVVIAREQAKYEVGPGERRSLFSLFRTRTEFTNIFPVCSWNAGKDKEEEKSGLVVLDLGLRREVGGSDRWGCQWLWWVWHCCHPTTAEQSAQLAQQIRSWGET